MTTIIQSSIIAINKDFTSHSFLKGGIKAKGLQPLGFALRYNYIKINMKYHFLPLFTASFALFGCASKPEVIVKTQYQDVFIPVACIKQMPVKPKFNPNNLHSANELMGYFLTCEELLKGCVNGTNNKEN